MESSRKIKRHSGEETPCLPEQLIMEEILPRLPVKSLLKFRCVSKSWCSLIGSKRFIEAYLCGSNCLYIDYVEEKFKQCSLASMFVDKVLAHPISPFADLGIDYERENVSLVGCCNGLLCILIDNEKFILWNPTTKKFKNLPDFNPKISYAVMSKYGFGFDEMNDDYKVFVKGWGFDVNGKNNAFGKVYSLRSNSWKDIEIGNISQIGDDAGIYVSGKLHWFDSTMDRLRSFLSDIEDNYPSDEENYPFYYDDDDEGMGKHMRRMLDWFDSRVDIVSFDLNRHVYDEVLLPSYYTNGVPDGLGVLGGCLSVHFFRPNGNLDVLLMKEYGVKGSWVKVATVPFYDDPYTCKTPFALAPNGEVLVVYDDSTMVVYNPKSGGIRHPHITGLDASLACIVPRGIYIKSLASVES